MLSAKCQRESVPHGTGRSQEEQAHGRTDPAKATPGPSKRAVHSLFIQGSNLEQIRAKTGLAASTVQNYLYTCLEYDCVPWEWRLLRIRDKHALSICEALGDAVPSCVQWPWSENPADSPFEISIVEAGLQALKAVRLKEVKELCGMEYDEIRFLLLFVKLSLRSLMESNAGNPVRPTCTR